MDLFVVVLVFSGGRSRVEMVVCGRSFSSCFVREVIFFAILYPSFPYRMSFVPCIMTIWSYSWVGLFDHFCSCSVVKISFSWCHVARLRSRNGMISLLLELAFRFHCWLYCQRVIITFRLFVQFFEIKNWHVDNSPMEQKGNQSMIDYIVIEKEDEQLVRDNIIDEAESMKIQGTNKSDHNTLCLALQIPHKNESTTITRWKLKKRRRMERFQQIDTEVRNRRPIKPQPDGKINKNHTGKTIGKTRIKTNRPSRGKETKTIKAIRKDRREKRNAFKTATRKNKNKHESMKAYIQSQAKLKGGIEKEHRENIRDIAKRINKEGGTKSQLFWKDKKGK